MAKYTLKDKFYNLIALIILMFQDIFKNIQKTFMGRLLIVSTGLLLFVFTFLYFDYSNRKHMKVDKFAFEILVSANNKYFVARYVNDKKVSTIPFMDLNSAKAYIQSQENEINHIRNEDRLTVVERVDVN
jgi:hypothetical protein